VFLFLYHFIEVDGTADLIRPFIAILSCSSQPCVMGAMDRMNHHSSQSSDYNAVGFTITCVGCQKPRLVHSRTVVKYENQNAKKAVQRMVEKVEYVCGSVLADYEGTGNDRDMNLIAKIWSKLHVRVHVLRKLSTRTTP
jgi:hypothetical protein